VILSCVEVMDKKEEAEPTVTEGWQQMGLYSSSNYDKIVVHCVFRHFIEGTLTVPLVWKKCQLYMKISNYIHTLATSTAAVTSSESG
jgi:hypothetical protein